MPALHRYPVHNYSREKGPQDQSNYNMFLQEEKDLITLNKNFPYLGGFSLNTDQLSNDCSPLSVRIHPEEEDKHGNLFVRNHGGLAMFWKAKINWEK